MAQGRPSLSNMCELDRGVALPWPNVCTWWNRTCERSGGIRVLTHSRPNATLVGGLRWKRPSAAVRGLLVLPLADRRASAKLFEPEPEIAWRYCRQPQAHLRARSARERPRAGHSCAFVSTNSRARVE